MPRNHRHGSVERQPTYESSSSCESVSEDENTKPRTASPQPSQEETPTNAPMNLPERVRAAALKRKLLSTVKGKNRKSTYYRLAVNHGWDRGCRASKLYELEDYILAVGLKLPTEFAAATPAQKEHLTRCRKAAYAAKAEIKKQGEENRMRRQQLKRTVLENDRELTLGISELAGLFSGLAETYSAKARTLHRGTAIKRHMRKPAAVEPSSESESESEEETTNPPEEQKIGPPIALRRERISDYTTRAPSVASAAPSDDMGLCDFEDMAFSEITEI